MGPLDFIRGRFDSAPEHRRRSLAETRRGVIILAICAAVIAALIGVGLALRPPERDALGCPEDGRAHPHTVALIDETDALPPSQIAFVRALVQHEYQRLPIGGRLTLRNITADPEDARDELAVCRIEDGSQVLGIGRNKRKVQRDFRSLVGARLDAFLGRLGNAKAQTFSPVLEEAAAVMDRPDFGARTPERRLVLVSDMAQHSKEFSQYAHGRRPAKVSDPTRETYGRDMHGVTVLIQYIRRPSLRAIQGAVHKAFWKGWFEGQSAVVFLGHDIDLGGR